MKLDKKILLISMLILFLFFFGSINVIAITAKTSDNIVETETENNTENIVDKDKNEVKVENVISDENNSISNNEIQQESKEESQITSNTTSSVSNTSTTSTVDNVKENINKNVKSNNSNLKMLGITPNDFKGFKASTTTYNVDVPNEVETINIYATAQDSKAKIVGTGNKKLNVGINVVNIIVTAEDGTNKTYTMNINRQKSKEVTENNTISKDDELKEKENVENQKENVEEELNLKQLEVENLTKLEIKGYEIIPKFSADVYKYTLSINGDISDLDIVAKGKDSSIDIEVIGNKELKDGENVITILVDNKDTKANSTYQIIVNKTNIDFETLNSTFEQAIKKAKKIRLITLISIIFIFLAIIIFIIRKKVKKKQEDKSSKSILAISERISKDNNLYKDEINDENKKNRIKEIENIEELDYMPTKRTKVNQIISDNDLTRKTRRKKSSQQHKKEEMVTKKISSKNKSHRGDEKRRNISKKEYIDEIYKRKNMELNKSRTQGSSKNNVKRNKYLDVDERRNRVNRGKEIESSKKEIRNKTEDRVNRRDLTKTKKRNVGKHY